METAHHFSPDARASAMVAFAFCLREVLPQAQLLGGGVTERGFGYEFAASGIPPDFHDRIQESYFKLLKSGVVLRQVDRLRQNALDWLDHCGQTLRARLLAASAAPIVSLVALGEFWEPCNRAVQSHLDRAQFYVKEMVEIPLKIGGRRVMAQRVQIVLMHNRSEAQRFRKKQRDLKVHECDHISVGRTMELFFPLEEPSQTVWIWRERGLTALERIRCWWGAVQRRTGVEILGMHKMTQSLLDRAIDAELHNRFQADRNSASKVLRVGYWDSVSTNLPPLLREGLLSCGDYWKDLTRVFCPKEGLLIELQKAIHLLELANSLFGLKSVWWWQPLKGSKNRQSEIEEHEDLLNEALKSATLGVIKGNDTVDCGTACAELKIQCTLGHWWPTGCIQIFSKKKKKTASRLVGMQFPSLAMSYSLFGSLERIIALLVEQKDRSWPIWLESEVLRLIPVTALGAARATSLQVAFEGLGVNVGMNTCIDAEGRGLQRALAQKVPYYVVLSDSEVNAEKLPIVCGTTKALLRLTSQEFAERISQQKFAVENMTEVSRV